jgi:GNAT superfamily N-acetyltransferase
MHIHSLGYHTDLMFHRFDGEVLDRGDYLVIRTPANPTFYWGNFLLFRDPPREDSLPLWTRLFAEEIASRQPTRHMVFGWDSPEGESGETGPFLDAGFHLDENVVLATSVVARAPRSNTDVLIRPLTTAADWEQALANQLACRAPGFEPESYREFKTRQHARYRRMAEAGKGGWFGAFADGRLVADLGVFVEAGVARFQEVETHPDFRRQGICGTLVYESSRFALETYGAEQLVMVADEHYHAARIYESVGFRPVERQLGLERRPKQ